MPDEIPLYIPDLDKISRLEVDQFFKNRQTELVHKIDEIKRKPDKKKWLWLVYGWLLGTTDEAEKIKPYVEDIPVLGFLLKYYIVIMKWQAKRLKIS